MIAVLGRRGIKGTKRVKKWSQRYKLWLATKSKMASSMSSSTSDCVSLECGGRRACGDITYIYLVVRMLVHALL